MGRQGRRTPSASPCGRTARWCCLPRWQFESQNTSLFGNAVYWGWGWGTIFCLVRRASFSQQELPHVSLLLFYLQTGGVHTLECLL